MHLRPRLFAVIGTRPEAIKLAPLICALRARGAMETHVCLTGQHRELLQKALSAFTLPLDIDLDAIEPGLDVPEQTARIVAALAPVLRRQQPDCVLVQGDTGSAMAAALTAFQLRLPVAHIEAGLRSFDPASPWPEETNRRLISQVARWHYAPTRGAQANLLAEGIEPAAIRVTGNTGIDALRLGLGRVEREPALAGQIAALLADLDGRLPILATVHRRETLGPGLARIADAFAQIAQRGDCVIILPAHPNPPVQEMARRLAAAHEAIRVVPPLDYLPFVALMQRVELILTDSGGIQEEAAALGKPVVVLRDRTERPELMEAGNGLLAGTQTESIVNAATRLLDDPALRAAMSRPSDLFGDGRAADRIAAHLIAALCGRAAA